MGTQLTGLYACRHGLECEFISPQFAVNKLETYLRLVDRVKASLILAFYNDIELLRVVLAALNTERHIEFEVVIADDGSSQEVVAQVKALLDSYNFPVKYIWQPDQGFGKAIILNKAVVAASGETLIFVDADCVPQASFVSDHLRYAAPGVCLVGRRVNVFRDALYELNCRAAHRIVSNNLLTLFWWSVKRRVTHLERGVRLPEFMVACLSKKHWGIVGCNFSVAKTDLLAVNGFDERHNFPWGAEDSDLQRRLQLNGVALKSLVQQACLIHFDGSFFGRKDQQNEYDLERLRAYQLVASENQSWTAHGIVKSSCRIASS